MRKKSEEKLRQLIREELVKVMTTEITWEKGYNDDGTIKAQREMRNEDIFVPAFLIQRFNFMETALRGMQETQDRDETNKLGLIEKVDALGQALISFETIARKMGLFLEWLEKGGIEQIVHEKVLQIEHSEVEDESDS